MSKRLLQDAANPANSATTEVKRQCQSLFDKFNQQDSFTDVTLVVGPKKTPYRAHRVVLSRCPYYQMLLSGPWKEGQTGVIHHEDVDIKVFEMMMEYLYTERIVDRLSKADNPTLAVLDLLALGDKMCLGDEFGSFCDDMLTVTDQSVWIIWSRFFNKPTSRKHQECIETFDQILLTGGIYHDIDEDTNRQTLISHITQLPLDQMKGLLYHKNLWIPRKDTKFWLHHWCGAQEERMWYVEMKHNIPYQTKPVTDVQGRSQLLSDEKCKTKLVKQLRSRLSSSFRLIFKGSCTHDTRNFFKSHSNKYSQSVIVVSTTLGNVMAAYVNEKWQCEKQTTSYELANAFVAPLRHTSWKSTEYVDVLEMPSVERCFALSFMIFDYSPKGIGDIHLAHYFEIDTDKNTVMYFNSEDEEDQTETLQLVEMFEVQVRE